ncbi:unnamed protein product [Rhizophagus irregularis]|nr:unnamed protein product [Rhizophagus irregularis]
MADNDCKMIQSALRSLERLSTSRLVFEPNCTSKQIAGASEELCSTTTSGKRDRVFASYMMSEEPCPKVQKVDHNALLDPVDEFFSLALKSFPMFFVYIYIYIYTSNNKDGQISSSTQVSNDLVILEPSGQTLPCILESGENFTDIWNEYLHEIDLNSWSVKHACIVKTFHNKVLKSLCSKADWKQIRGNQLHLAEEGLLERLKPVLQKKNDKQSLLQNFAQIWECPITSTEAMRSTIMSFITGKAIRDGDMEYTWGEIVRKTAEDFYKLLREMRDMLHASKKEKIINYYDCIFDLNPTGTCPCSANDVGIQKRVISANQGWNNLKSRYEANNSQESSDEEDDYTKQTPKK